MLGTDGQKMSKSRGNTIAIGATAEETAEADQGRKTDAERHITYDPVAPARRSRTSCASRAIAPGARPRRRRGDRRRVAAARSSGSYRGGQRAFPRRSEPGARSSPADRGLSPRGPRRGERRAREIAEADARDVRTLMHTIYPDVR